MDNEKTIRCEQCGKELHIGDEYYRSIDNAISDRIYCSEWCMWQGLMIENSLVDEETIEEFDY